MQVLYEDEYLLVLNKPSGVVVNRSATSAEGTVQDFLDDYLGIVSGSDADSEFLRISGLVHRIDKGTSGVLIAAKSENIFKNLQKQFKKRQVEKAYLALVVGHLEDDQIEITAPIKRNPKNRFKFAVVRGGKGAFTRIERLREFSDEMGDYTLVRAYPKSGRTHQIRVHLTALGHPIIYDRLYSSKKQYEKWGNRYTRLMLHAEEVVFTHPITKNRIQVRAPIPEDFPKLA